ncbi:MAG TPA: OmpH family outer membrane protein [Parachlamydiaceae bacterium]|nr:OmpH family outer membrane protein [Parachlamydiaceae bacterium]
MKLFRYVLLNAALLAATSLVSEVPQNIRFGVAHFKTCVDQSLLGKEEQANFEALKKQVETSFAEKEKVLADMAEKFDDADYLDSLSPEAETELKRNFRQLSQELNQLQNQYYQMLTQANMKIIQKLESAVDDASKILAAQKKLDAIFTDESLFFYNDSLDISKELIAIMDGTYEKEIAEMKEVTP